MHEAQADIEDDISPAPEPEQADIQVAADAPALQPARRGRGRPRGTARAAEPQRHSERLANKEPAHHVDMTDKAVQLKSLKNKLADCSKELKAHVNKKGLLGKNKKPIPSSDLRKMAAAAGLGKASASSLVTVPSAAG